KGLNAIVKGGVLFACLIGLLFANYRTAILAIVPIMVTQFALGATEAFPKSQRAAVALVMGFACFALVVIASVFLSQRFSDIAVVVQTSGDVIKPPIDFTRSDIHLLSGRAY